MISLRKRLLALFLGISMAVSNVAPVYATEPVDESSITIVDDEAMEIDDSNVDTDISVETNSESEVQTDSEVTNDDVEQTEDTSQVEEIQDTSIQEEVVDSVDTTTESIDTADESKNDTKKEEKKDESKETVIAEPTVTITPEDQDNKILDAVMETYIKEHVDASKTGTGDMILANIMTVQQTLYSSSVLSPDSTIDSLMTDNFDESSKGWLGNYHAVVPVYSLGDGAYYVAYANTMMDDSSATVQDVAFAHNNNNGEVLDNCIYDEATGLVYLLKDDYKAEDNSENEYYNYIQVQFLQNIHDVSNNPENVDSSVQVVTESDKEVDANTQTDTPALLNTTVQTESGMKESKVTVSVNGIPLNEDGYIYDSETGEVIVGLPSASVSSITVTEEPTSMVENIQDGLGNLLGVTDAYAATLANMGISPVIGTIKVPAIDDKGTIMSLDVGDYWQGFLMYEIAEEGTSLWNKSGIDNDLYLYKDPNHATVLNIDGTAGNDLQILADAIANNDTSKLNDKLVNMGRGLINAQADLVSNGTVDNFRYGPQTFSLFNAKNQVKKTGNFPFSTFNKMGLACGHISSDIMGGVVNAGGRNLVRQTMIRVLAKGTNNGKTTLTIGLLSASANGQKSGQSGVALYRVYYETEEENGYVKLKKESTEDISGNNNYSLQGTTFEIINNADKKYHYTLTTDANGNTKAISVPIGEYSYKETKAGKNMRKDAAAGTIKVTKENTSKNPAVIKAKDSPQLAKAQLIKTTTDEATRKIHAGAYDFVGTTINIYKTKEDRDNNRNVYMSLVCENNGKSAVASLPFGTYYYKEVKQGRNLASTGKNTSGSFTLKTEYVNEPYKITVQNDLTYGYLQIKKTAKNADLINGNQNYSLEGTQFTIYPNEDAMKNNKNAEAVITLKADGISEKIKLSLGTHWYKETKVGKNMVSTDVSGKFMLTAKNTKELAYLLQVENQPILGSVQVQKRTPVMDENTDLSGAVYTLYRKDTDEKVGDMVVAEFIDDATKEKTFLSNILNDIPYGEYYYKETKAPTNGQYQLDPKSYDVTIKSSKLYVFDCIDDKNVSLKIKKSSTLENITNQNSVYNLEDTQYGIYATKKDAQEHVNPVMTFTIKKDGTSDAQTFTGETQDSYWYSEIKAGKGYQLDDSYQNPVEFFVTNTKKNPSNVTTDKNNCIVINVTDEPYSTKTEDGSIVIRVAKKDADTNSKTSVGKSSLAGAIFEVRYYDGYYPETDLPEYPTRKWQIKTVLQNGEYIANLDNPESLIVANSDELYREDDAVILPCGTLTVAEVQAPKGYELPENSVIHYTQIKPEDCSDVNILIENLYTEIDEQAIRGDISLVKISTKDNSTMANVPFAVISQTTGETHIVVTDANGNINTAALRASGSAANVNKNDEAFATGRYNGKELNASYPVYFKGVKDSVDDVAIDTEIDLTKGALPYDTYIIRELRASANTSHELIDDFTITVNKPHVVVDCGNIQNEYIELRTEATANDTGLHVGSSLLEDAIINDKVVMEGLDPMTAYTVIGTLRYSKDGSFVRDKDGNIITSSLTFTPQKDKDIFTETKSKTGKRDICGFVILPFHVNPSVLDAEMGQKTVVFEQLFFANDITGKPISEHEDKDDDYQTVTYPIIKTTARDKETGMNMGVLTDKDVIIDSVAYNGLYENYSYIIRGSLVDKENPDGEPLATAETEKFKATSTDGLKELQFTFDSTKMAGKEAVAFERLYLIKENNGEKEEILIAVHEDVNDTDQTISYPSIDTEAEDADTGTHTGTIAKHARIIDKATFKGIQSNTEYTVNGVLYDVETGKELLDEKEEPITQTVTFKLENALEPQAPVSYNPETKEWTVPLVYNLDSSLLEGKTVVVFEDLLVNNKVIAAHHDIHDEEQSIHYPKVHTVAQGSTLNILKPEKDVTITDTATCMNLVVGESYILRSYLVVKNEDNPDESKPLLVNGRMVTGEVKIDNASQPDMKVKTSFTFDARGLEKKKLVVYADLYQLTNKEVSETNTPSAVATDNSNLEVIPDENTSENPEETLTGSASQEYLTDEMIEEIIESKALDGYMDADSLRNLLKTTSIPQIKSYLSMMGITEDILRARGISDDILKLMSDEQPTDTSEEEIPEDIPEVSTEVALSDEVIEKIIESGVLKTMGDADTLREMLQHMSVSDVKEALSLLDVSVDSLKEYGIDLDSLTNVADDSDDTITDTEDKSDETPVDEEQKNNLKEVLKYRHENPEETTQTIFVPGIATTLVDVKTKDHIAPASGNRVLTDTVVYNGLMIGQEYKLVAELQVRTRDKDGKIVAKPLLDKDGKPITVVHTFKAKQEDGAEEVKFTVDASLLNGKTVVAFESLRHEDIEIAVHADIMDEDQSVYFPDVKTTLIDAETLEHMTMPAKERTVIDSVLCTNLVVGKEYTISGELHVKTGDKGDKVLTDASGEKVTATKTFTAQKTDEIHRLIFNFDASALGSKKVVAFETLQYNGEDIVVHADINDEAQTVYIPQIATTLLDDNTQTHIINGSSNVNVTDTVYYKGLIVGKEYTVEGALVIKEDATGKAEEIFDEIDEVDEVKDESVSEEVPSDTKTSDEASESLENRIERYGYRQVAISSVTFVAEKETGTVKIPFEFDGSQLLGKTLVAFEVIKYQGKEIASHEDIDDEEQTAFIPEIRTTLTDHTTHTHITYANKNSIVYDDVVYKNLIPGKEYVLKGILMNKKTGKALKEGSKEITSTKKFTPDKANGTIRIPFTFDGSVLAGTTVVAFERLYYEDMEIAVHTRLDDEDQTTYIPSISTTATINDKKEVTAGETVELVDTVKFKNLVPNEKYILTGTVMDKSTKNPFKVNGKELIVPVEFTPQKSNGNVNIRFKIDTKGMKDTTLVVFEELKLTKEIEENGKKSTITEIVAVHKDIEDKNQTVHITDKEITPTPTPPTGSSPTPTPETPGEKTDKIQTSDTNLIFRLGALMILSILTIFSVTITKRKQK